MGQSENIMGTKKIFPLLLSMSLPPMVSMMIQALYNIVDSIFVARLNNDALTAVSLAFPLQNFALAAAVGFGVAINACISQGLGAKDKKRTDSIATHGLVFTIIHSIIFVFIGLFATAPFLEIFAQSDEIFKMSCDYSYIVISCAFLTLFHLYVEKMFQATGNMVVPMIVQGVGAIVNIILDPIFIFGLFGFPVLGVKGAAIATIIGQVVACAMAFLLFIKKSVGINISLRKFKLDIQIIKNLYIIAVPSSIMMALPSLLVGILNGILIGLSEFGVGVFGVYYKLQTFVYMPANGVIQGMRPIMGYNYGAKKFNRMKQTLKSAIVISGVIMILGTLLFFAIPEQIMLLFNDDPEIMETGVAALRIISVGFAVSAVSIVFAGTFESLGKGIDSLIVSLFRVLLIVPPLAFVLSKFIGLYGIWLSFPIAEIIASIIALLLYKKMAKTIYK